MGVFTRGPSECSFCTVNYGHHIGSCPKKRPRGKHPVDIGVDILIEKLHGGILLMRGELVEENLILQNLEINESKW